MIPSHSEAPASGSLPAAFFSTSVASTTAIAGDGGLIASDDHARAHNVVLQSSRAGSSGIEALGITGGSTQRRNALHPAKKHGSIETLLDAALASLVS